MKGCSKSSALALNYCSLALRHRCQVYNNTLIGNYGIYTADGWEIAKLSINYYWKLLSLYATLFISTKFLFNILSFVLIKVHRATTRVSKIFVLYILNMEAKVYCPHKLCLIWGGWSWHPFINLSKTHCCVSRPRWIFWHSGHNCGSTGPD